MHLRNSTHILTIGWLALLICLWTTGDRVIDLVFEEPDVTANTDATAEEPDNAAEHLLVPSQRAGNPGVDTVTAAPAVDLDIFSTAIPVTDNAALKAAFSPHPPPRNSPVSFSVPLRI